MMIGEHTDVPVDRFAKDGEGSVPAGDQIDVVGRALP